MNCAWFWMYLGAALMLLEILLPGFVVFFFGLAAVTVGLVKFAFFESFSLTWQFAAFSLLSILYIAVLRRWLKGIFMGESVDGPDSLAGDFVGRTGKVTEAIEPPASGRVEIGDAEWRATSENPLAAGTLVKVVSQQNITMKVEEVK